ncbi:hypothetical protein AQ1_01160 [alpha proteobacterium Q-1]|nr:hypothetical protein AQ1_01160 [alpha proteobacterium Q-1]
MSVDIEAQIIEDGHNPQKYVTTPVFTGSVAFCAGEARALGLWVGYDPLPDNPYHGEVWNSDRDRPNRFRRGQERGLHNAATWYVRLEGIEIR